MVDRSFNKEVPPIGFGTSKDDLNRVREAVGYAFQAGYRMIDTATFYKNEVQVGEAIREAIDNGTLTREDIYVVTKLPPNGAQKVRYFLEKSLKNLKVDYVDLYLIHNPAFIKYGNDDQNFLTSVDGVIQYDHTHYLHVWKEMEKCVDDGLCRSIGVSNFNAAQLEDVYLNSRIKPQSIQVECHVYLQEEELFQKCRELGVNFTAFAPLGSPGYDRFVEKWIGKALTSFSNVLEEPVLSDLAKKYKKTPAQIALRWLVQRGISPIPKSFNKDRIKENIQVFDFCLLQEDMNLIRTLDRNMRNFTYTDICKGMDNHPNYPFNLI